MVEGDSKRFGCIGNIDLLIFAHQQRERAAKKQSNHARYHEWLLSKQTPQNVLCVFFFGTVSAEPNVNAIVISRRLLFWHMCVERYFDKNEKIMRALEPKPSVCIAYEFLVFTFVIIERGWCDSNTETHTSARSLRHLSSSSFDTWSIEIFLHYFDDFWWTSKCSCTSDEI